MKEVLTLNGGINLDSNPLYLKAGEVLLRKNGRVTATSGGREGINTSVKGMQQLAAFPVSGTNKCIGEIEDKERDQTLIFVYNSLGNHDIYKIKGTTITPIGADASVLNFNTNEVIDADILGDYCVFVSEYNPPRKINITEVLTGKDTYDIQLAVRPPSAKPSVKLASDADRVVNKMIGKTFQFASMFIYEDYTYSVVSPYSDVVVSPSMFSSSDNTYTNNHLGNYVQVSYDMGNSQVQTVRLLAREGNIGSWFVVDEFDVAGAGGTRTINFYNDIAKKGLTETEALALYSDVPRIARTVKTVQNRISLGNVLKGYDKTSPIIEYAVDYEDVNVSGSTTALDVTDGTQSTEFFINFEIPTSVTVGDVFALSASGRYLAVIGSTVYWDFNFSYSVSYEVVTGDTYTDVMNYFMYDIQTKGKTIITSVTEGSLSEMQVSGSQPFGGGVNIDFIGVYDASYTANAYYGSSASQETPPQGVSTLKGGSYYNVGVLFYDDYSRTSGLLQPNKIYVPHAGERDYADAFDRARISFSIADGSIGVPSWAKYYRFAVTESVNFAGVYPFVVGNDSGDNIKTLFLDGKNVIAINMPTNMQYEFAKGDYLQIEVDSGSAITSTITKTIIGTRDLLTIADTEYAGFWLIVPKGNEAIADYDSQLAYIYRTKDTVQDLVYFESSETYSISGGVMQTLSGYVGGEDAWYVQRKFEWDDGASGTTSDEVVVEDFYLNVDDAIRAYSKGRVVVEFDTLGEVRLQDFVWSFNYLDGTKINGISTFNSLNREQLDEKDGEIQRIELVGDVIKVIQDNKETSLYVGKAQISDAEGNLQVVKSNDFIGAVNASDDDYGSRYPLSIRQHNRNLFYWDGDKGEVVRSSPNGQIAISDYRMRSEFLRIKEANPSKVFGVFDEKNDEYLITFVLSGVHITYSFKNTANVWNAEWEYNKDNASPDLYTNVGTQVYSIGFGYVWKHESNSLHNTFYGAYKPLLVRGVLNTSPREEKCLLALEMDSNRALKTTIETPVTNTLTLGEKSYLYAATYRNRDGNFTSAIFKNILTTAGEDISIIHTGQDMVGKYATFEFLDASTSECQLRLVTITYSINQ